MNNKFYDNKTFFDLTVVQKIQDLYDCFYQTQKKRKTLDGFVAYYTFISCIDLLFKLYNISQKDIPYYIKEKIDVAKQFGINIIDYSKHSR